MLSLIGWKNESDEGGNVERMSSLSGYLWKMKRGTRVIVPQWNKRWFSVEGRYLKWYEVADSEHPSGSVDLNIVDGIRAFDSAIGAYSFLVTTPERKLVLRAASRNDMNKWIRALNLQADLARGGLGMSIICEPGPPVPGNISGKGTRASGPLSTNSHRISTKPRTSRTLEADLDWTLSRLNELEKEISVHSACEDKYSQDAGRAESKQTSFTTQSSSSSSSSSSFSQNKDSSYSPQPPRFRQPSPNIQKIRNNSFRQEDTETSGRTTIPSEMSDSVKKPRPGNSSPDSIESIEELEERSRNVRRITTRNNSGDGGQDRQTDFKSVPRRGQSSGGGGSSNSRGYYRDEQETELFTTSGSRPNSRPPSRPTSGAPPSRGSSAGNRDARTARLGAYGAHHADHSDIQEVDLNAAIKPSSRRASRAPSVDREYAARERGVKRADSSDEDISSRFRKGSNEGAWGEVSL